MVRSLQDGTGFQVPTPNKKFLDFLFDVSRKQKTYLSISYLQDQGMVIGQVIGRMDGPLEISWRRMEDLDIYLTKPLLITPLNLKKGNSFRHCSPE
jgi:hypothetical protein